MNELNTNEISQILIVVLGIIFTVFIALVVTYLILIAKTRRRERTNNKNDKLTSNDSNKNKTEKNVNNSYSKKSIFNFMEFEKIEDNMIIQKNGRRFLMVVECQGVNYDLMSKLEKVGVEEGFQQFLNTLRHPIQIYIQTRTINLESTLVLYKQRINAVEDQYRHMLYEYERFKETESYTKDELNAKLLEVTKQKNLLDYGKDIVSNTEKMSLNKNVLNKKYYIVIPYFSEESNDKYDNDEMRNIAFSELYTKSQALIRTLSSCSVSGKILSSKELIELLYIAYNRDDSEIFGVDKAISSGYEELYSTSPDVYEKKIKALDRLVNERAVDLANYAIEKVKSESQQRAENKEESLDKLVDELATMMIEENRQYVGEEVAQKAVREIKESSEGGDTDEEIQKNGRGRKSNRAN